MMNGGGGGIGWIGPVVGLVVTIGLFGLIAWAVAAVTRRLQETGSGAAAVPARRSPDDVLADRFARGEIDVDEYTRRREVLRSE